MQLSDHKSVAAEYSRAPVGAIESRVAALFEKHLWISGGRYVNSVIEDEFLVFMLRNRRVIVFQTLYCLVCLPSIPLFPLILWGEVFLVGVYASAVVLGLVTSIPLWRLLSDHELLQAQYLSEQSETLSFVGVAERRAENNPLNEATDLNSRCVTPQPSSVSHSERAAPPRGRQSSVLTVLSSSPTRLALRSNAKLFEWNTLTCSIGTIVYVAAVQFWGGNECPRSDSNVSPECVDNLALGGAMIGTLAVFCTAFPARLWVYAAFVVLYGSVSFAALLLPWSPRLSVNSVIAKLLMFLCEAIAGVGYRAVKERGARQQYELFISEQLRAVEMEHIRRATQEIARAQIPHSLMKRIDTLGSSGGLFAWDLSSYVCVASLNGFYSWSNRRAALDTVVLLLRIFESFEKEMNRFCLDATKYHSDGDNFIVILSTSDELALLPNDCGDSRHECHQSPYTMLLLGLRFVAVARLVLYEASTNLWSARNALLTPPGSVEGCNRPKDNRSELFVNVSLGSGPCGGVLLGSCRSVTAVGPALRECFENIEFFARTQKSHSVVMTELFANCETSSGKAVVENSKLREAMRTQSCVAHFDKFDFSRNGVKCDSERWERIAIDLAAHLRPDAVGSSNHVSLSIAVRNEASTRDAGLDAMEGSRIADSDRLTAISNGTAGGNTVTMTNLPTPSFSFQALSPPLTFRLTANQGPPVFSDVANPLLRPSERTTGDNSQPCVSSPQQVCEMRRTFCKFKQEFVNPNTEAMYAQYVDSAVDSSIAKANSLQCLAVSLSFLLISCLSSLPSDGQSWSPTEALLWNALSIVVASAMVLATFITRLLDFPTVLPMCHALFFVCVTLGLTLSHDGSVISNGTAAWTAVRFGISIKRPLRQRQDFMAATDILFYGGCCVGYLTTHRSASQVRVFDILLTLATFVLFSLTMRLLIDHIKRENFVRLL